MINEFFVTEQLIISPNIKVCQVLAKDIVFNRIGPLVADVEAVAYTCGISHRVRGNTPVTTYRRWLIYHSVTAGLRCRSAGLRCSLHNSCNTRIAHRKVYTYGHLAAANKPGNTALVRRQNPPVPSVAERDRNLRSYQDLLARAQDYDHYTEVSAR